MKRERKNVSGGILETIRWRRAKEVSESREKEVQTSFDKSCHPWCLWCSERHARWEKAQLKGRRWSMRGYLIRALRAVGINRDLKASTQANHKLQGWLSISSGKRRRKRMPCLWAQSVQRRKQEITGQSSKLHQTTANTVQPVMERRKKRRRTVQYQWVVLYVCMYKYVFIDEEMRKCM